MADTRTSYDAIAARYARDITPNDHKPFDCAQLDRLLDGLPDGPILDLGCGPGDVTRYLRARRAIVTGIDLSLAMIDQARQADPQGSYGVADMTAFAVAPGSVAALAAFYSLIHIPPELVLPTLRHWRQALRPGGRLLIAVHIGTGMQHLDTMLDEPVDLDFHFFETAALSEQLRDAGFALLSVEERDPYPEIEVQTQRLYILATRP